MKRLAVFSGEVFEGFVGDKTLMKDCTGKILHVGDIVMIYHDSYPNTDIPINSNDHFTCVVDGKYENYKQPVLKKDGGECFVMSIANCFNDCNEGNSEEWSVQIIKSHNDVIDGEHWRAFGFNYKYVEQLAADLEGLK